MNGLESPQLRWRTIIRGVEDDVLEEGWFEDDPPRRDPRRRAVLGGVAALIAAAMLAIPFWQVIDGVNPPISDTGLEICRFDYCIVQEAVIDAGLGPVMTEMSGTFLDLEEAQAFADLLLSELGGLPITVVEVTRLDGRASGRFITATRTAEVERPMSRWTVMHEVVHSEEPGHGEDFLEELIDLARWWADRTSSG